MKIQELREKYGSWQCSLNHNAQVRESMEDLKRHVDETVKWMKEVGESGLLDGVEFS